MVKAVDGLVLCVKISEYMEDTFVQLFQKGVVLFCQVRFGEDCEYLILYRVDPLEDEFLLKAFECCIIGKCKYDFNLSQYILYNRSDFVREYNKNRIHSDDIFRQTVRCLFCKCVAEDSNFAKNLY